MDPIYFLIGGVAFIGVLLVIGVLVSTRDERAVVQERFGKIMEEDREALKRAQEGKKSSPLTDWLNTTTEQFSWGQGISRELARADMKLKVGEYLAVMFIAGMGTGAVVYILTKSWIAVVISFILGLYIPKIYVGRQQVARLKKFNEQLSDMLNLMVNGLRAGYSTMQAMEAVSKELPSPICDEFRRVVQEMQLGVSMEVALDNLLRRIPSPDLDLVITAINVQREVGGNLAEILDTISHTIRERVRIKGEIQVLTSQVAYSGKFLSAMPFIVFGALFVLNRKYIGMFFDPKISLGLPFPVGYIGLAAALLLIAGGYAVMQKIADIEV